MNHSVTLYSPQDSITHYLRYVMKLPMLSADEERRLAKKLRSEHDLDAARSLILAHLRFVVSIAKKYRGYGLPLADIIQEGNIGLMKAVKRFDPDQGVRLVTFAVHWIKAEIYDYIIKNWRIVKIATTKAQRKLFFNLRKMKKGLMWLNADEKQAIAKQLGVSVEDVRTMEQRLNVHDTSLEIHGDDSDSEQYFAPMHHLTDENQYAESAVLETEQMHQSKKLQAAFAKLDVRSQQIIQRRWLNNDKCTLQDLALEFGISLERIRQLEKAALEKLREWLA